MRQKLVCKDCKYLDLNDKHSVGCRCHRPNHEWKRAVTSLKQPSGKACKAFESRDWKEAQEVKAYKCDKCGKLFEKLPRRIILVKAPLIGSGTFDLCEDCQNALEEFMGVNKSGTKEVND